VSSEHAMIFYRDIDDDYGYFLKDVSRFGTYVNRSGVWELFHHEDVALQNGTIIRLGAIHGQTLEFLLKKPHTD
ncbi:FHA domain-containing protein, partial [Gloeocapsa sp. PCC 73106]|uniref:FHA domain-containing protein n=1 Tax=Gloeocapsa sp. PCC 73106 TaxID=102232 RepID=UPI0002ACD786